MKRSRSCVGRFNFILNSQHLIATLRGPTSLNNVMKWRTSIMIAPYYCPLHPNFDVQMIRCHVWITTTLSLYMWTLPTFKKFICKKDFPPWFVVFHQGQCVRVQRSNPLESHTKFDFAKWQLHSPLEFIHKVLRRGVKCNVAFEAYFLSRAHIEGLKSRIGKITPVPCTNMNARPLLTWYWSCYPRS